MSIERWLVDIDISVQVYDVAERVISGLDEMALAAASIAQVHKVQLAATNGGKGEQLPAMACLKVQHANVDRVMTQDMWQMDLLIRTVA